ncbi:MAG: lysophospholipid acyltransferase family protein [Melioribacteraceae bacterium]|nr:lysophospholipid acyltransferase family protein [Melioribacteraceae bacterium]
MKLNNTQKKLLRFIGIKISNFLIDVLLKTVRIEVHNFDVIKQLENKKNNYIVAFWHGSMLIGWYLQRNKKFAALVSKSKDGDVLTSILEKWNFHVVRGSSSNGGHEALDNMIHLIEENFHLAITPDGPTGPIMKFKAGAVITSYRTQVPLILLGIGMKNKWQLKSWDKFEIPKPFSKVVVIFSNPIIIGKTLSRDEINIKIKECENLLNELQNKALLKC